MEDQDNERTSLKDLPIYVWTYQLKFEAAWEALRLEYQPSTVTDLSLLKEQIMGLTDQIPGGFDQFKSEFHRLHTEILATNVPDAIMLGFLPFPVLSGWFLLPTNLPDLPLDPLVV